MVACHPVPVSKYFHVLSLLLLTNLTVIYDSSTADERLRALHERLLEMEEDIARKAQVFTVQMGNMAVIELACVKYSWTFLHGPSHMMSRT